MFFDSLAGKALLARSIKLCLVDNQRSSGVVVAGFESCWFEAGSPTSRSPPIERTFTSQKLGPSPHQAENEWREEEIVFGVPTEALAKTCSWGDEDVLVVVTKMLVLCNVTNKIRKRMYTAVALTQEYSRYHIHWEMWVHYLWVQAHPRTHTLMWHKQGREDFLRFKIYAKRKK